MKTTLHGAIALAAALSLVTGCKPAPVAPPAVRNAWLRPAVAGGSTAAYFTIANLGKGGVTLQSVDTDVGQASLHSSSTIDGIARMRPLDSVMIPGRSTSQFQPGGNHVMVMGVKRDLRVGDRVPLRLRFGDGMSVDTVAAVANGEGGSHGGH